MAQRGGGDILCGMIPPPPRGPLLGNWRSPRRCRAMLKRLSWFVVRSLPVSLGRRRSGPLGEGGGGRGRLLLMTPALADEALKETLKRLAGYLRRARSTPGLFAFHRLLLCGQAAGSLLQDMISCFFRASRDFVDLDSWESQSFSAFGSRAKGLFLVQVYERGSASSKDVFASAGGATTPCFSLKEVPSGDPRDAFTRRREQVLHISAAARISFEEQGPPRPPPLICLLPSPDVPISQSHWLSVRNKGW